jgi:PAS domain S-box-containing protein
MPDPDLSAPRPARVKSRAARRATTPPPRWAGGVLGLLAALAAAPLWWPDAARGVAWLAAAAAMALGLASVGLLRRALRESRVSAAALDQFSQRLRQGDVSGALRAVGAVNAAPIDDADSAGASSGPWPGVSRFADVVQEVESALGERERRWQARMRLSADWHWETDRELRFSWVSRDLASLVKLGLQATDLLGRRIDLVAAFDAPEGGWPALIERMEQHTPLRDLTLEVRRPGRAPVWVALNGRAHRDAQGQFAGYEGVGRDVTEQRLAYLKLAESEHRHALMADLAVDWYWQTDAEHRFEPYGPAAHAALGDRALEAVGKTRWERHAEGASDAEWAAHRADLEAHRSFRSFEYGVRQPGHGLRWISIGGQPRFDARGEFIGYHGVGRDITLRKRAERVLLNRNQALERLVTERTAELEQSNHDLEAFSRQLAHELRTPISQIAGLADLLKARAWERLAADEREWLRLQGQAAREMSHTVTALLELARSASTALLLEPVDLTALAQAVIEDLPWIERKAPIEWHIEPGLAAHCCAALARVVLLNLLGNAAKFSRDADEPRIAFASDGEGGFVVSDNGAGFDAERAATLFQPFVRLHGSDEFQGTGLGLSIVRRIVERHGGNIAAAGESGRGARFAFRLGAPRAPMPQPLLGSEQEAGQLSDAVA